MTTGYVELLPAFLMSGGPDGKSASPQRLKEACQEFEAIFLGHMLRSMKKTVGEGGLIPKSSGMRIFEEMMDDQIAREMAQTGRLGLGDMLLRELAGAEAGQVKE